MNENSVLPEKIPTMPVVTSFEEKLDDGALPIKKRRKYNNIFNKFKWLDNNQLYFLSII